MHTPRTESAAAFWSDRTLQQYDDAEAADAAAEDRGAAMALEQLVKDVQLATPVGVFPAETRMRHFIASFVAVLCVRGDRALARAIADAAGAPEFYIGRDPS
ncbi:hypothetical protein [Burkholderia gladioli]|uniref:hypothetical protein n=1 Tax=Burkholderia gladioli TaxID=28095 RepID=UPI0006271DFD|nr:hypothetical protein [Burkholderia gladioli]KKJ05652.1 hypothetical protein XF14_16370 [Burkholderia gladioli]